MKGNGDTSGAVLSWPKQVLSADDLRRYLTSQREIALLPRAIVTPLAADELKARGIRIRWEDAKPQANSSAQQWGYAQERPDAAVEAAIEALKRDQVALIAYEVAGAGPVAWARGLGALVARTDGRGSIAFCGDPGVVCCVANKLAGVRAVAVGNPGQAERARKTVAANLLAIESPGRTFFEIRQIVRAIVASKVEACPAELANALKELDGHAHR